MFSPNASADGLGNQKMDKVIGLEKINQMKGKVKGYKERNNRSSTCIKDLLCYDLLLLSKKSNQ